MTYFLQLLAIICRFNYANAPANLGYYEILLDVALFDIDILKPSCVIGWTFTRSVVAQFGVVVVGFVVNFGPIVYDVARDVCAGRLRPCGVYASLHYYDGPYGPRATRAAASVLALIDVQQTTIAFNAFASFRCDAFEGYDAKFLREQPDESCDGPNAAFLIILGLSTTVVFTLGLPHLLLGSIEYECEANGGVHHSHVQDLLGWNFGAFRAPHHGWRIRRIYLSVVICLAATMFDDPLLQIAIALAAVFQTYADHLRNEPYIEPRLNRLETMGLQLVALALLAGILRERARFSQFWLVLRAPAGRRRADRAAAPVAPRRRGEGGEAQGVLRRPAPRALPERLRGRDVQAAGRVLRPHRGARHPRERRDPRQEQRPSRPKSARRQEEAVQVAEGGPRVRERRGGRRVAHRHPDGRGARLGGVPRARARARRRDARANRKRRLLQPELRLLRRRRRAPRNPLLRGQSLTKDGPLRWRGARASLVVRDGDGLLAEARVLRHAVRFERCGVVVHLLALVDEDLLLGLRRAASGPGTASRGARAPSGRSCAASRPRASSSSN